MIEILILLLAIPVGYLIARLAYDELKDGRIWFKLIILIFAIVGFCAYFFGKTYITWTSAFIIIVTAISLRR